MTIESTFLHMIISLGILLFAAKLMAELFHRIKLPVVLGELLAECTQKRRASFWARP